VFQDFGNLTDDFMAAAVDPSLWGTAMDSAVKATSSFGATLLTLRRPLPCPPVSASMQETVDDYIHEGWRERDGLDAWRAKLAREGIATVPTDLEAQPYYQEFLRPRGLRWFVSIKAGDTANHISSLGLYRTVEQGPYSAAELARLAELSRALAGTAKLAAAFGFARIDAKLSAFERSKSPVVMIDRGGEVLRLNPSAERLLGDDLKIVNRRLVSWNLNATRALDGVLHRLLWKLGEVKPVVLPRRVGRPIIAYPSRLSNTPYDCFAPAQVLIVFADLEARRQVDMQPLMDAFGLCLSEARVTSLLVRGMSIENAAESLGIAVSTARNQIKSVFEKTDTHSQGQLISLVSQLIFPAIL